MKKVCLSLLLALCAVLSLSAQTTRINTGEENKDWNPKYTIDFVAAFDPDGRDYALSKEASLEDFGRKVVDRMNIVMRNSNINGRFQLKGTYVISSTIPDIEGWPTQVLNDRGILNYVKSVEGDICLVFAPAYSSQRPATGNAFFRADPGLAYGCVKIQDAYTGWTAIHEAGHIMGCHHALSMDGNPDRADTCTYNYGAERHAADDSYHYSTIMGYYGELLPYFSSPNLYHKGIQMGSDQENNVLVLNTRMPIIATLGDRRTDVILSHTDWTPGYSAQSLSVSFRVKPGSYRIASDADWLTTNISQGYTDAPFTISVSENTTGAPRTGHVTVTDWDWGESDDALKPATITVTQGAGGGGTVTPGEKVLVTSVTVEPASLSIPAGSTYQLKSTVLPANATNPTLRWWSGNDLIATVSATGLVTAKTEGETIIYADSTDGTNLGGYTYVTVTKATTTPVDPGTGGSTGGEDKDPEGETLTCTIRLDGTELYLTTNEVKDNDTFTYSLAASPEEFNLVPSGGGYTIQSASSGKYVGYTGTTTWDCFDKADVWTIANVEGLSTTILKDGKTGLGVDKAEDKAGVFTDKPSEKGGVYTWIIEPVKETPVDPVLTPCATPVISLKDGVLSVSSATPGATISYAITAPAISIQGDAVAQLTSALSALTLTLTATAKAAGYLDSEAATHTFTLAELLPLLGDRADVNADGHCSIEDVTRLVDLLLKRDK